MYFTVNLAFINYFDNLIDSLTFLILLNRTTYEQILPISLEMFEFKPEFTKAPKILKDFAYQFKHKKEIFDLQEWHITKELEKAKKKFFFDNHTIDVFLFVSVIISLLVTLVVCYMQTH